MKEREKEIEVGKGRRNGETEGLVKGKRIKEGKERGTRAVGGRND